VVSHARMDHQKQLCVDVAAPVCTGLEGLDKLPDAQSLHVKVLNASRGRRSCCPGDDRSTRPEQTDSRTCLDVARPLVPTAGVDALAVRVATRPQPIHSACHRVVLKSREI
jgi:hypothetical protein